MGILQNALDTFAENVKHAADEAQAGGKYGLALKNITKASAHSQGTGLNFGFVDYTYSANNPVTESYISRPVMPWSGQWLYVERSSIGAPIASFISDGTDAQSFVLSPGRVIRVPFERVQIFYLQITGTYNPQPGILTCVPGLRVIYGEGECPFTDTANSEGSDSPVLLTLTGESTPGSSVDLNYYYAVPPGALLDVSAVFNKVSTGQPDLGIVLGLYDVVVFAGMAFAGSLYDQFVPDFQTIDQRAGDNYISTATWRRVRMPRGLFGISVNLHDYNAAPGFNELLQVSVRAA